MFRIIQATLEPRGTPIQGVACKSSVQKAAFEGNRMRCQEIPGIEVHRIEHELANNLVEVWFSV
jgi:hypothetical protein